MATYFIAAGWLLSCILIITLGLLLLIVYKKKKNTPWKQPQKVYTTTVKQIGSVVKNKVNGNGDWACPVYSTVNLVQHWLMWEIASHVSRTKMKGRQMETMKIKVLRGIRWQVSSLSAAMWNVWMCDCLRCQDCYILLCRGSVHLRHSPTLGVIVYTRCQTPSVHTDVPWMAYSRKILYYLCCCC